MKMYWKWLTVLLLAAMLCLGVTGLASAECHHWVLCQNPTVCVECGAQGVSVADDDVAHEWLYTNLGDMHQLFCLYCDYQEEPQEHFAFCDATTVCAGCGATGLTLTEDSIMHYDEYTDLGTQHQYHCTVCGYQDEPENHWAICDDPVTCAGCGIVKIDIPDAEIYHDEQYVILDEQHQVVCDRCDYTEPPVDHVAVCTAPTACFYCKTAIAEAPLKDMLHFTENVATNITDTTHENYCTHCGFSWGVIAHRVNCANPTTCFACGKTGLNTADYTYYHAGPFAGMTITSTGHSFDCGHCGKHADNEAHTFDKGFCYTCGYEQGTDAPDEPDTPDVPNPPDTPDDPARTPGDADGDGSVSIMDALAILQYDVGWGTAINTRNADVNADGTANIMDALLILQYDVGWDVELK